MNVFIIAAPYQVLSAIEAIQYFNCKNNILIILYIGLFSKKSFYKVIDKKYWDSIRFSNFFYYFSKYDFSKNRPKNISERLIELYLTFDQLRKRKFIDNLCKSIGFVENLFLGNYLIDYDLHMRHIANHVQYKSLFLIDVGTDTLRINRQRINENLTISSRSQKNFTHVEKKYTYLESFSIVAIKNKITSSLVEWDKNGVDKLTYFTCYPLRVNGKDQIVNNSYTYSKSLIKKLSRSQDIFFLGQPLVDQGYLNLESLIIYIKNIKNYFNGSSLIYVPHPRESKKYVKVIQNDIGIKIKKNIAPFEYEIVFGNSQPKCIAAFFTSALETCAAIFGDTIELLSFQLPQDCLLKDKDTIKKIYENFNSNNNIKVIALI
ncbi:MAG TPA: hypothetical protein PKU77_12955 [Ferruginibacter sp.]|nr:hypothetical protein [Ferruginibacter sp.]